MLIAINIVETHPIRQKLSLRDRGDLRIAFDSLDFFTAKRRHDLIWYTADFARLRIHQRKNRLDFHQLIARFVFQPKIPITEKFVVFHGHGGNGDGLQSPWQAVIRDLIIGDNPSHPKALNKIRIPA